MFACCARSPLLHPGSRSLCLHAPLPSAPRFPPGTKTSLDPIWHPGMLYFMNGCACGTHASAFPLSWLPLPGRICPAFELHCPSRLNLFEPQLHYGIHTLIFYRARLPKRKNLLLSLRSPAPAPCRLSRPSSVGPSTASRSGAATGGGASFGYA